ncbi:MAG: ATP-binding cassette domain-containing protein, partial [bacterium]|nr:ATP-binding cassette domain-containing protein [bacterium]
MITVQNVTIANGKFRLENLSFSIPTHQYGILMGKTGCGKTTLLEAICGLKPVQKGSIQLMGQEVTRCRPSERGIGYVPQDGALFTHMTIFENLAFALTIRKTPESIIKERVEELAALL